MADEPAPTPPHGAELRGMDLVVQSPTAEGRFGFMFKNQPPHSASDTLLDRLGAVMEEQPTADPTSEDAQKDDNDRWNENPSPFLTSGVTFLGQFVDHDITFDTTLLSDQQSDPYATTNFRTPRYDLDAIYGRGPALDPQFYNANDRDKFDFEERPYSQIYGTLKVGTQFVGPQTWDAKPDIVYDVPRTGAPVADGDPPEGTAKIADPRNDQTLIILQLHIAMQKFHNRLVDYMRAAGVPRAAVFESARRLARWHYQWIVIHEFLPAIVGTTTANLVYKDTSKAPIINIKYYKPTNSTGRPFIPVEFAVAAYRFGHSITRPRYTVRDVLNSAGAKLGSVAGVPLFDDAPVLTDPLALDDNRLNGHRELLPRLKIQWSKFFNADFTKPTARPVRQFDASLAHPLFQLPPNALPDTNTLALLSQRNLRRGRKMGLPSGERVAKLMGVTPLTPTQLYTDRSIKVTIPIASSNIVETQGVEEVVNQDLKNLFEDPLWPGETPLWFYILKEAEHVGDVGAVDIKGNRVDGRGRTLGPVGGRIVAEVLVGLLQKDVNSYLYLQPTWKPATPIATTAGKFTMADLLKFANVWS